MAVICRILESSPDAAAALRAGGPVEQAVKAATVHSGMYRYWQGIAFLLSRHAPDSLAGRFLSEGTAVSAAAGAIPAARLHASEEVKRLAAELEAIDPDALAPDYDAEALDEAGIYPKCWVEWEETFDPLGQMLEHYHSLREFTGRCAASGNSLLLYFEDDGDDV
jgi:hypothetical protein